MNTPDALSRENWQQANKAYLAAHLEMMRHALKRAIDKPPPDLPAPEPPATEEGASMALDTLCEMFHLSPFERDILLLCAGIELDSEFASLCAEAQGNPGRNYPTFSLALALFPHAYWSALSPTAPLRRWRLIEVEPGRVLTLSPLHIDERILHYLVGVPSLDARLTTLLQPLWATGGLPGDLVPSHQKMARELAATWVQAMDRHALPVLQLCGGDAHSRQKIAAAACAHIGHGLFLLTATALPTNPTDFESMQLLWEREAALSDCALLLECQDVDTADTLHQNAITRLIEANDTLLIIGGGERRKPSRHMLLTFDVQKPTADEQYALWQKLLGDQATILNGHVRKLVSHFYLDESAIHAACSSAQGRISTSEQILIPEQLGEALWDTCLVQFRPRLDELAQRIEPAATWEDLIIPDTQRALLRDVAMHVRQRAQVYDDWGFRKKGARGLGVSALFFGVSGVGKTMATEVLASELHLDVYRIDLSAVVSKYIGETEKNLRQIFDAAESGGTILLFDEADALFGKRSEVKDSHDRYANVEISYLLQRMEAYQGLAILTTNMKDALDNAFLRRIRFIVQFPFPDAVQRAAIWRRIFPDETPTERLDVEKLAQLNVTGGSIRNIALYAAFIAADAGEPVRMQHILRAARSEYAKMEKALSSAEIRGWDEADND